MTQLGALRPDGTTPKTREIACTPAVLAQVGGRSARQGDFADTLLLHGKLNKHKIPGQLIPGKRKSCVD